jgi:GTPase SAR1 family protein
MTTDRVQQLFNKLIISGCVFSAYLKNGPEALFGYPLSKATFESKNGSSSSLKSYTLQNYLQIAVKSISLLLGDYIFEKDIEESLRNTNLFGVLPYPDIGAISLTYFTYIYDPNTKRLVPTTLSILIDETKRSFIYDYTEKLQQYMKELTQYFVQCCNEQKLFFSYDFDSFYHYIQDGLYSFFKRIYDLQEKPIMPLSKSRPIKIILTGLEGSGKTSFLSVINKKYSQLIAVTSTQHPKNESFNLMGTSIIRWDVPGTKNIREEILKSEVYFYDMDILYYFIDGLNPKMQESLNFLKEILANANQSPIKIPVIFVISKIDEDINQNPEVRERIHTIISSFTDLVKDRPFKFFETSIFAPYSVSNAFSYGIRQLSPNRNVLEHLIREFLIEHHQTTGLLLNEMGLVLAVQEIGEPQNKKVSLEQIFEITAPHFTSIATQYNEILALDGKNTQYQFSDEDLVVLKRFTVEKFTFFLLFYNRDKKTIIGLDAKFPEFVKKIENLLKMYII